MANAKLSPVDNLYSLTPNPSKIQILDKEEPSYG
jgi:hypothetical protein